MASILPTPAPGRKSQEDYTKLGRNPAQSMARTAQMQKGAQTAENRPPIRDFDNQDIEPWIVDWFKATFQTDVEGLVIPKDRVRPFPTYPTTGQQGHYDLAPLMTAGAIRIALAGDWGTGTNASQRVADNMMKDPPPELTIHLGDIYYVGTPDEVAQNCLGQNTSAYQGVTWPHGTRGSFALNGNHEMYSGGHGYFENFLPTLGIPTSDDQKQLASYFCLETPQWRILGIDTGYNSDTLSGDCHLEQPLLDWLKNKINPVQNRKPTVVLSHHQWFSGFGDGDYTTPAEQIAPFLANQQIVWLWGHEHRLALYSLYKSGAHGLSVYARCMGHGGMPNEMPDTALYPDGSKAWKVEYWDGDPKRVLTLNDKTQVSRNGYVQMAIQDSLLTLEYFDFDGASVLKESFTPNGGDKWDGTLTRRVVEDPHILTQIEWQD